MQDHDLQPAGSGRLALQQAGQVDPQHVGMFVLPGAAERLKLSERARFVTESWPRIVEHADMLGVDLAGLLECEPA